MAKFFVTNNKPLFDAIKIRIHQSEFKIGFLYEREGFYALSVKKLFIDNVNGWNKGADMVITTGTPVYKESLDNACIIEDFDGNVNDFRRYFTGQYAVVIRQDGNTCIFCDAVGAYSIYWYNDGSDYLISNDISDMAAVLGDKVAPGGINILEEACQNSILCGDSLYDGIRRLSGHEKILISKAGKAAIEKLPVQKRRAGLEYEDCVTLLAERFEYKAGVIKKIFGDPDIFMTGGHDSRISLAAYLRVGARPSLHYGIGNSAITNTKKNDLDIVRTFAQRYGLPLYEEDWSTPSPIYRDWGKYIAKYGVFAKIYAASDSIVKSLENLPNRISTFGYGGEFYRNLPWIERRKKHFFTAEEFVDEYYIYNSNRRLTQDVKGYRDRLVGKIRRLCADYDLNPKKIDNKDNIYLLKEYRCYADTYLLNMINQMRYSSLLCMEQDCIGLTDVPVEDMNYSRLMLDVIKKLYGDVLEIPVFSHCKTRQYNRHTGQLDPVKIPLKSKIANSLPEEFIAVVHKLTGKGKTVSDSPLYKDCIALKERYSFYPGYRVEPGLSLKSFIHYAVLLEAVRSK